MVFKFDFFTRIFFSTYIPCCILILSKFFHIHTVHLDIIKVFHIHTVHLDIIKVFSTCIPCILILSKLFNHQLMPKWVVLKTILKFTLKLTINSSYIFPCNHHHQGAHYSSLLKLQLLKWSLKIHRCGAAAYIYGHTTELTTPMYFNWLF
jgi:hypothetical protein